MATARFTIYIAPGRGRPGRPLISSDVVRGDGVHASAAHEARFGWRMLAANNREVARSASTYAELASCIDAVRDLRIHVSDGLAIASRTGRADWSWRLRIDGADEATSSRTYQRRLQCEAACALFVELVPDAEFVDLTAPCEPTAFPAGAPIPGR